MTIQGVSMKNEDIAALRAELASCKADRERLEAERDQWIQKAAEYKRALDGAQAFERSVNEALNSGDGVYRP